RVVLAVERVDQGFAGAGACRAAIRATPSPTTPTVATDPGRARRGPSAVMPNVPAAIRALTELRKRGRDPHGNGRDRSRKQLHWPPSRVLKHARSARLLLAADLQRLRGGRDDAW